MRPEEGALVSKERAAPQIFFPVLFAFLFLLAHSPFAYLSPGHQLAALCPLGGFALYRPIPMVLWWGLITVSQAGWVTNNQIATYLLSQIILLVPMEFHGPQRSSCPRVSSGHYLPIMALRV